MKLKQIILVAMSAFSLPLQAGLKEDLNLQFSSLKIYSDNANYLSGHLTERGKKVGTFFEFNKETSMLKLDDKSLVYKHGKFVDLSEKNNGVFRKEVMPYFANKYGFKFSEGNEQNIYIFLDYTCQFSKAFVERGELERYAATGATVWVLPISRLAQKQGILNYGALHCTTPNKESKAATFLSWMRGESKPNYGGFRPDKKCNYWEDLKPYYGIVSHLKIEGVPAVIKG